MEALIIMALTKPVPLLSVETEIRCDFGHTWTFTSKVEDKAINHSSDEDSRDEHVGKSGGAAEVLHSVKQPVVRIKQYDTICKICHVLGLLNKVEKDIVCLDTDCNKPKYIFQCAQKHTFSLAYINRSHAYGCPVCRLTDYIQTNLQRDFMIYGSKHNHAGNVYHSAETMLRFHCRECRADFFSTAKLLKNRMSVLKCADMHWLGNTLQPIVRTKRWFELYFRVPCDDHLEETFAIQPTCYNKKKKIAVVHGVEIAGPKQQEKLCVIQKACNERGIYLIYIPVSPVNMEFWQQITKYCLQQLQRDGIFSGDISATINSIENEMKTSKQRYSKIFYDYGKIP